MPGHHRQFAQPQDQQRIAGALEDETNSVRVEDVDAQHFLKAGAVQRMTFLEQHAVGERDVVRGDWRTIVEPRFGAQVEHHPTAVFGVFQRLGDQAITGSRLVAGRCVLAGADH